MSAKGQELKSACIYGRYNDAQQLIRQGADVECAEKGNDNAGWSTLMWAAFHDHAHIVRLLLDNNADIHHKNVYGRTALHIAAYYGTDEVVRLLIERGADLHCNDNNFNTPLECAKLHKYHSSTISILEAATKATKVICTTLDDIQKKRVTLKDFDPNSIILITEQDTNPLSKVASAALIDNQWNVIREIEGHPVFTLQYIRECMYQLLCTDDTIPTIDNNTTGTNTIEYNFLSQQHPILARRMQHWGLNLLHLITYFPESERDNDTTYQVTSSLLTKFPQAATAVDIHGRTPLHHAVMNQSFQRNMGQWYDLLLHRSPPSIVHQFIEAGMCWYHLRPIVLAKITSNVLTIENDNSGLLPFMSVAERCNAHHVDGTLGSLSMVYELLCMKPEVLKDYEVPSRIVTHIRNDSKDKSTSTTTSDYRGEGTKRPRIDT